MLVLSRRQREQISFPNLGIKLKVLSVAGKVVRIGIDAPDDVRVLRSEIEDQSHPIQQKIMGMTREQRHEFRDRLNSASLGLQVLQRRLEGYQSEELESVSNSILEDLAALNRQLGDQQSAQTVAHKNIKHQALIVEDNMNEANLLAELLSLNGYQTHVVRNGLEAISYLEDNILPDVVLLDMNMPEMDGPATIKSIRSKPNLKNIKLIGVSGLDRQEANIELGSGGVNRWFTKPVDVNRLVSEINCELVGAELSA